MGLMSRPCEQKLATIEEVFPGNIFGTEKYDCRRNRRISLTDYNETHLGPDL
jgi:hypothetical protein